jgi:hypothetical protein
MPILMANSDQVTNSPWWAEHWKFQKYRVDQLQVWNQKDNILTRKNILWTCCKAAFRGNKEIMEYQLRMGWMRWWPLRHKALTKQESETKHNKGVHPGHSTHDHSFN